MRLAERNLASCQYCSKISSLMSLWINLLSNLTQYIKTLTQYIKTIFQDVLITNNNVLTCMLDSKYSAKPISFVKLYR